MEFIPNLALNGLVSSPERVVAPIRVKLLSVNWTLLALGPLSIIYVNLEIFHSGIQVILQQPDSGGEFHQ